MRRLRIKHAARAPKSVSVLFTFGLCGALAARAALKPMTFNQGVAGSNPAGLTKVFKALVRMCMARLCPIRA